MRKIIDNKIYILVVCFSFIMLSMISSEAKAQSRVYMSVDYVNYYEKEIVITVSVRERIEKKFYSIKQLPIDVNMKTENGDTLLAVIESDSKGIAYLVIEPDFPFVVDDEGISRLQISFSGDDKYKKAKKSLKVSSLKLDVDLSVEDEIVVKAISGMVDSLEIYPDPISIGVYVERMFADYKLGDLKVEDGKGIFKIEEKLPGDKEGNINLKLVLSSRKYQTIEYKQMVPWGVIEEPKLEEKESSAMSYILFMFGSFFVLIIVGIVLNRRIKAKN